MKVAVIGSGYVGTTAAAIFANSGHSVVALDIDQAKVDAVNSGQAPFYEAGLNELLANAVNSKQLSATADYQKAIKDADIILSAVGTPDKPDGSSNLDYIFAAAKKAAKHLKPGAIYVQKSTVPVGTGRQIVELLPDSVHYLSNPEFLRESTAVIDTLLFDRVVVGGESQTAVDKLFKFHQSVEKHAKQIATIAGLEDKLLEIEENEGEYIAATLESTELIKVSANAFLAMKISFANSIAKLCDQTGADITEVMTAVGRDSRIGGAFLNAGRGYGGGCFPKDVSGLIASAQSNGVDLSIMTSTQLVNESMPGYIITKTSGKIGGYEDKTIAVLGLAFKSGTSDTRKSAGIKIANKLIDLGATVRVYDPEANDEATPELADTIAISASAETAVESSDAVFVTTDWPEFNDLLLSITDTIVVDCMNTYDPGSLQSSVNYVGVGRD